MFVFIHVRVSYSEYQIIAHVLVVLVVLVVVVVLVVLVFLVVRVVGGQEHTSIPMQ